MKCLVDGDVVAYRCGFAVEKNKYHIYIKGEEHFGAVAVYRYKKEIPGYYLKDEGCYIEKVKEIEPLNNALHLVKELLQSIIGAVGATSYQVYLTGEGNFREKIAVTTKYKGNRDPLAKPKYLPDIREYMVKYWDAKIIDEMEADDAIGIEQMKWFRFMKADLIMVGNTIICSIDKDLDMIPGWHYNFVERRKYWITEQEAIKNFYLQLLTGDRTDNIQGCVGIGKKTAEKLLSDKSTEKEMLEVVRKQYNNDTVLNEMAQLLWIRRADGVGWKAL